MSTWYMLTLVGKDQAGIVAKISKALFELGCQLGETSMMRLGGNFTMMLMTQYDGELDQLEIKLTKIADALQLRLHIDPIEGRLHDHVVPNLQISVHGADRPGIVARVTDLLEQHQFNILDLESDVGGTQDKPIYIMHIVGTTLASQEVIVDALQALIAEGIHIKVSPIDTLVG